MTRLGILHLAAILATSSYVLAGEEVAPPPVPLRGLADADLASFDDMMLKFLADHRVPGGALAVAKDGKLVYSRGFGHADPQLGLPVEPAMRFRIASISKPITAVMILRLVEMGLLSLDENPFDLLKIAIASDCDQRLRKITIHHLLQHTAGWDRAVSGDPMFRPVQIAEELRVEPPAGPRDVIQHMVRRKLDFDPGARYAYSNFGYCLLGRVIEKVTGRTYEAAVQKHIFDPLGIRNTQLGRTLTTAANEVKYIAPKQRTGRAIMGPKFGEQVPTPYGAWYLEAMDSHGGWISTAPDLARFACAFDEPSECRILKPASIRAMFARPEGLPGYHDDGRPLEVFYGYGWNVRPTAGGRLNTWHMGLLDGTATILVRRADRLTWAVLFNTSLSSQGTYLGRLVDSLVHQAAGQVQRWPERDLFEKAW